MSYGDLNRVPSGIATAADTASQVESSDGLYAIVLGLGIMDLQDAWMKTLAKDREASLEAAASGDPALINEANEKYQQDSAMKDTILQQAQTTLEGVKHKVSQDSDNMANIYDLESPLNGYMSVIKNLVAKGF